MFGDLPGVDAVNVLLLVAGGAVLASALFKRRLRHAWLSDPILAIALGVLAGPAVLGLLRPDAWTVEPLKVLEQAARLTIALSLMRIGVTLPRGYVWRRWRLLGATLSLGMLLMWAVGFGVAWLSLGLFGGVGALGCLLVAACVTPTDPVLAGSIVQGKTAREELPGRMRRFIEAESGANDGLAYLFLFLPVLLLTRPATEAWRHWLAATLLWEVLAAVALGAALGVGVGWLQRLDERRGWSGQSDVTITTLALTATTLGLLRLLGTDGILGVFAAAVAFKSVTGSERVEREEETIQNVAARLTEVPVFVLLGAMLPWSAWASWGWAGAALAAGVLLLRRPLAALALAAPWRRLGIARNRDEVAFLGWFGPIGVAALFYATLAHRRVGATYAWEVVSLVVVASALAHGLTAFPLTRLLGRRLGRG